MRHALRHAYRNVYRQTVEGWLFRLGKPEPGEAYLSQRRIFILPTKAGLGFGLMLAVLFIGAVNYNLSLGLALTFLLAACAVIDMHLTFRNLAYLHLASGRAHPVFAGEEARFELHLFNRRDYDRYAIWLGFAAPRRDAPQGFAKQSAEQPAEQSADLAAQSSCSVTLAAQTDKRGWLAAPRIRLHSRFPLGLLRAWSYWQPDAKVLVYPRPEEQAPPLPLAEQAQPDGHGQAGQEDFSGVRAYQPGDSMKRLAWRQMARLGNESGVLISKHFEGGAVSRLQLDLSAMPAGMDLEAKLSRMTRWVLDAEAQRLPYAFRLGEFSLEAACGAAHRDACLRALALYGEIYGEAR